MIRFVLQHTRVLNQNACEIASSVQDFVGFFRVIDDD